MIRKTELIWISLAAFAGASLFHTSYRVQALTDEISSLEHEITSEQDGIQVLKAEWSFLNDPVRLEQLTAAHLTLKPITVQQISTIDMLPMRSTTLPANAPSGSPAIASSSAAVKKNMQIPALAPGRGHDRTTPAQGGLRGRPGGVMLVSAQMAPAQPLGHKLQKQPQPVVRPTYSITRASFPARGPAYAPAKGDIDKLLTRIGRIQ